MDCGFHTKRDRWDTLGFSKEEISWFHIGNSESDISRWRKAHFFQVLGTTEPFRIFRLSVYIRAVLPVNFPEQFELCLYFKYSRSYEAL